MRFLMKRISSWIQSYSDTLTSLINNLIKIKTSQKINNRKILPRRKRPKSIRVFKVEIILYFLFNFEKFWSFFFESQSRIECSSLLGLLFVARLDNFWSSLDDWINKCLCWLEVCSRWFLYRWSSRLERIRIRWRLDGYINVVLSFL